MVAYLPMSKIKCSI